MRGTNADFKRNSKAVSMEFVWTLVAPMSEWLEPPGGVREGASQKLRFDNRQLQLATLAPIHAISAHPGKPPVEIHNHLPPHWTPWALR